jgi:hypothetical protein
MKRGAKRMPKLNVLEWPEKYSTFQMIMMFAEQIEKSLACVENPLLSASHDDLCQQS